MMKYTITLAAALAAFACSGAALGGEPEGRGRLTGVEEHPLDTGVYVADPVLGRQGPNSGPLIGFEEGAYVPSVPALWFYDANGRLWRKFMKIEKQARVQ